MTALPGWLFDPNRFAVEARDPRNVVVPVPITDIIGLGTGYTNCRTYGAVADGVTNDSPAVLATHVAAAVNASKTFLPAGTYAAQTPIPISIKNTRISGEHRDATVIKMTQAMALFTPDATAVDLGDLLIENLTIDMQGSTGAGGYALFCHTQGARWGSITVRNCKIKDPGFNGRAFWLEGASNVTIDHVDGEGVGAGVQSGSLCGEFILMSGCRNVTISNCSGRLLSQGIGASGTNQNVRILNWTWDGCIYTGPTMRGNSGGTVTYGANTLRDTAVANWSLVSTGWTNALVRVLETRTTGTITSVGTERRYTVVDAAKNFTAFGILEQELVRSPSVNPVWEANVIRNGTSNGVLYHDGWRDVASGAFGVGPAAGDTYTVHRVTLGQGSPTASATDTVSIGWWFGMDGTRHTPANGSRYEWCPSSNYGCHVASGGAVTQAAENWYMYGCVGKRTLGDPYSIWDPATLVSCHAEWSTDTCFTFNANDGVIATDCTAYNSGANGFYISSVNSVKARHVISNCVVTRWGWSAKEPDLNFARAFFVSGIGMSITNCHAYADSQPNARVGFVVGAVDSQILDCATHDLYPGNRDIHVYAGADNGMAGTFIRGRHTVDQTIPPAPPPGNFLGSVIWDLVTPQLVNGVLGGQPTSRVISAMDGLIYTKPPGSAGKSGWKVVAASDPPDWSPIDRFGAPAVVSWVRVTGHVTDIGGVADSVADLGLMSVHPPTALTVGHRMAYGADAAFNNRTMLTMAVGKGMFANWGATQINGSTSMTLIWVGRAQNTGSTGYVVTGKTNAQSSYASANASASADAGNAYAHSSPAISGNLPQICVVVWDRAGGVTKWYENDATAPRTTDGAPGTAVTDFITLGCYYNAGAGGFYAQGVIGEAIRLNIALTADQVYEAMVGLSVYYGLTITT